MPDILHNPGATKTMQSHNPFDDLIKNLLGTLPAGMQDLREDAQRNLRATLAAGLQRLDLVTRAEFDAQRAVLDKARQEITELHRKVDELLAQHTASEKDRT